MWFDCAATVKYLGRLVNLFVFTRWGYKSKMELKDKFGAMKSVMKT